jgi:hypothetical protein
LTHIQFLGGILLRKTIAFGAIIILSAGLASVPASATTAKTGVVAMTAKSSTASIAAAKAKAAAAAKARAAVPRAGATCAKSLALSKIGKYQYICAKNSKKKYVWTKLSSDCVGLLNPYLSAKANYDLALKQLAIAQAAIAKVPNPDPSLATNINTAKSGILQYKNVIDSMWGSFTLFCS